MKELAGLARDVQWRHVLSLISHECQNYCCHPCLSKDSHTILWLSLELLGYTWCYSAVRVTLTVPGQPCCQPLVVCYFPVRVFMTTRVILTIPRRSQIVSHAFSITALLEYSCIDTCIVKVVYHGCSAIY